MATVTRKPPTRQQLRKQRTQEAINFPLDWLEERSGLVGGLRYFLFRKVPRELNWIIGVLLLVMGMAEGFTGYLLPWDQTAYWATVVGINLNGTAPFLGPWLAQFLRSGQEIGGETLARFYSLHMLVVPGGIAALIGPHLYLVIRLGVTSPPWSKDAAGREPVDEPASARSGLTRPVPHAEPGGR